MESRVIFYNRFVSLEELVEFISAADIYITPYLKEEQITSGTLAYTLAQEKQWFQLHIGTLRRCWQMGGACWFHFVIRRHWPVLLMIYRKWIQAAMQCESEGMFLVGIWSGPKWQKRYLGKFSTCPIRTPSLCNTRIYSKSPGRTAGRIPPIEAWSLTSYDDETGILQHAIFTIPNYSEGYTIDDNARALLISPLLEELGSGESFELASRYLAFVWYAFNAKTRRFRNNLVTIGYGRKTRVRMIVMVAP